ncbi:MAG: acyl-CoA dehydrogenase [Marmoricola sp.]|nr:acyl-CoA dehydrogenase [Marmoricola sp.]
MIDLTFSEHVRDLTTATEDFIRTVVLPVEDERGGDIGGTDAEDVRRELQSAARAAGIFAPHVPRELGGHGLGMADRAPVFEAAGYSTFGPLALNIAAPDEGNMHLLHAVATAEQREQFLVPLARGEVRSAFAMTEPAPGAGSDPAALATYARRHASGGWLISGEKRFITGADGAEFFIVMARTVDDGGEATMFLVPASSAGVSIGRHIPTMDRSMIGGHCEVSFQDVRVGPEAVLGEVDRGFAYAQVRLGPARMTHVMRWLGSAQRAQDCALEYASSRSVFGSRLGDLGMAQQLIADNEIDLAAARALLLTACASLDRGERAATETSIAKTFGAEAICRVVDRAMQLTGGAGVSDDLPIARLYREVRPFRIYDGPSEVHRWSIARRALRQAEARR